MRPEHCLFHVVTPESRVRFVHSKGVFYLSFYGGDFDVILTLSYLEWVFIAFLLLLRMSYFIFLVMLSNLNVLSFRGFTSVGKEITGFFSAFCVCSKEFPLPLDA